MLRRLIGVAKLVIILNIMAFLDDCVTSHDAQLATNLQFKVRLIHPHGGMAMSHGTAGKLHL